MRKIITALAVGVLIAVIWAAPASAAKPVVVVDEPIEEELFVPAEEFVCGVDAHIERTGKVRVTEFFDKDGELDRVQIHARGTTVVTTAAGSAIDRWSVTIFLDFEAGTETTVGNVFNVHVPGSGTGVLVNDSGRLVLDLATGEPLFVAGPHPAFFDPDAFDQVCALATAGQ